MILGGGLYQLTGPKDACLRRCRDLRAFLDDHWRPGRVGALRMGAEHGRFCVPCCWGLMAALFALGVPEEVPGFTVPGSHQGEGTMDPMQMP